MGAALPQDIDPAAELAAQPGQGDPGAAAEALKPILGLSPFVSKPEMLPQAIKAADEVWRVAAGQLPASQLLEGFRASNPAQFQSIVNNLAGYIEQVTGKKFGGEGSTPADPMQQRLSAIEQSVQQEQQQRAQAAYQGQVAQAHTKALELITAKTKGTFAEGSEGYLLAQCGARAGVGEAEMVQMILSGNTQRLEAAYKNVVADEVKRLKAFNANLIKQSRMLKNAVPAARGAQVNTPAPTGDAPPRKPGESNVEYATRLWNEGYGNK